MKELHAWLEAALPRISGRSDLAAAIRYTLSRWEALTLILRDGRACIDNSAAERAMRPIAIGRRNWTSAGSDNGGHRAAVIYSLVETAIRPTSVPNLSPSSQSWVHYAWNNRPSQYVVARPWTRGREWR